MVGMLLISGSQANRHQGRVTQMVAASFITYHTRGVPTSLSLTPRIAPKVRTRAVLRAHLNGRHGGVAGPRFRSRGRGVKGFTWIFAATPAFALAFGFHSKASGQRLIQTTLKKKHKTNWIMFQLTNQIYYYVKLCQLRRATKVHKYFIKVSRFCRNGCKIEPQNELTFGQRQEWDHWHWVKGAGLALAERQATLVVAQVSNKITINALLEAF
jgi:hypothetical protein